METIEGVVKEIVDPRAEAKVIARLEAFPNLHKVLAYDDGRNIENGDKKSTYVRNLSAMQSYAKGALVNVIETTLKIKRQWLNVLLRRHEELGRAALVRHTHSGKRDPDLACLTSGGRAPNKLSALWKKYPRVEFVIRTVVTTDRLPDESVSKGELDPVAVLALLNEELLKAARKLAVESLEEGAPEPSDDELRALLDLEFPATSPNKGLRALQDWMAKVKADVKAEQLRKEKERAAANRAAFPGDPSGGLFFRVDCDGHYVDVNWTIECLSPTGVGLVQIHVKRLWFIPMMEEGSGAILGYSYALGENYGAEDVCRAARNALVPWQPRELTVPKLKYGAGECMPNAFIPELQYVCWDELHVDNAKAHLADVFMCSLENSVGCAVNFGPAATPNARPKIEKIFHLLAQAGFHKFPATTGSHPDASISEALKKRHFHLKLEVLLDLIDILVCRWNASCASDSTESRLSILKRHVLRDGALVRHVPKSQRERVQRFDLRVLAKIGTKNRKPIVRWDEVEYDGAGLSKRGRLIGQPIFIDADSDDPRRVQASLLSTGESLGELLVEPRYRDTVHSVTTRKFAKKLSRNNRFSGQTGDIILAMRRESTKSVLNGSARRGSIAARAIHEQLGAAARAASQAEAAEANVAQRAAGSPPHPNAAGPKASADGSSAKPKAITEEQRQRLARLGATH